MSVRPDSRDIAKKQFFEGMSFIAATVNVVTTDGPAGRAGVTVSAMSSVSADTPRPTLLVCINESSSAAEVILENGVLCVNVLRDSQPFISDAFAGRYRDRLEDKFDCTTWETGVTGAPRVADALVAFDCRIVSIEKVGTHHVCFAEVLETFLGKQGSALIYANRAYGASSKIEQAAEVDFGRESAKGQLRVGCFHTFGPFMVPRMVAALQEVAPDIRPTIIEGDTRRLKESLAAGEIDLALMYAFEDDESLITTDLMQVQPYVLLTEGHPLTEKTEVSPADLAGEPMIGVSEPASSAQLESFLTDEGIAPNIVHRSASIEMVRGMVGHGLGCAIMLTKPAAAVTYDGLGLASRPLLIKKAPGRVVIAQRADSKDSDVVWTFKTLAMRLFSEPKH